MPLSIPQMNYHERLALLDNPDFVESCNDNGESASELLDLSSFSRAAKCSQPIIIERANLTTGEVDNLSIPCGSANADNCASCADFLQRLRARQILDTLARPGIETALFTTTAPSFGKVHRAYWTEKDEFKNRHLDSRGKYRVRLLKEKNSKPCPCGQSHTYEYPGIGTPIHKTYDYLGETIWSHSLPALMKATYKSLKRLAVSMDIDPAALRLYTVYERQARASLHAHTLIAVEGNTEGFLRLIAFLKGTTKEGSPNWTSPTAEISTKLVKQYKSAAVAGRMLASNVPYSKGPADAIPLAHWKNSAVKLPAIRFGNVFDVRILEADEEGQELSTKVKTYNQAAAYISKYLTKNQSAFSPKALKRKTKEQKAHFYNLRKTAINLYADLAVFEVEEATLVRERAAYIERREEAEELGYIVVVERLTAITAQLAQLRKVGPRRSAIVDNLLDSLTSKTLGIVDISEAIELLIDLGDDELSPETIRSQVAEYCAPISRRSLKIRLNKLANNGGFTGTLTVHSNWRKTLTALREDMAEFMKVRNPSTAEYEYLGIDLEAMREAAAKARAPQAMKSAGYLRMLEDQKAWRESLEATNR
jgi:hypothetical protein